MRFLVDYNLDGYAAVLLGVLAKSGWLELLPIQFITFRDVQLPMDSSDRTVWQYAQTHQMLILTANRNMKGNDSLEQVMREENSPQAYPIVTIGDLSRFDEAEYRERTVNRIIEIVLDLDNYMGVGRVFIP
jgi:predicted nuclease of predicted toxin-antitoxin system